MLVLLLLLSGPESPSSAPPEAAKKKILTVPTLQHDSALLTRLQTKLNPQLGVLFILGLVAEATDSGL